MTELTRYLTAAALMALPLGLIWLGYRFPPPQRPKERPEPGPLTQAAGEALGAAVGLVGVSAGLCWVVLCLALFLAPLVLLVWVLV